MSSRRRYHEVVAALAMVAALALFEPGADALQEPARKTEKAETVAALGQAEQAVKANDFESARRLLREIAKSHGTDNAQLESRRLFQLAVIDQLEAEQGSPKAEALLRRAAEGYSRVVELAPGAAAALYNLGRVHQQLGNLELAAKAYESAAQRPGKDQVFYLRQWAEFLGAAGREREAEAVNRQLVLLDPRLEEPHRNLSERYLEPGQDSSKLLSYLWELVKAQQSARAEDLALTALERPWPEWTQPELLTVVAASLGQRVRAPSDLSESPTGKRLAALAGNAQVGAGVQQLLSLYAAPGVVAAGSLNWWMNPDLEWAHEPRGDAIRAVLRGICDGYRERGEAKIAAACYQAAIDASPSPDPLALRELAGVYVEQNQLQALNDLAARYADPAGALFGAKNEGYRSGQLETVLQYHRTLGQIYGALAVNGKAPWGDVGTPTTAMFQLERAYRVGKELDGAHPESYGPKPHVDPDLAALLAKGYEAQGDTAAGNKVRLDAAERFTSKGDVRAKDKVLRNIPTGTLTPEQIQLYRRYEGVKEVTPRAPAATAVPKTAPVRVPKADPAAAAPQTVPTTTAPKATAVSKAGPSTAVEQADSATAGAKPDPQTVIKVSPSGRARIAARAAPEPKAIEVPANVLWIDTGIDVKAGQRIEITASGAWSDGGPPAIGPGGYLKHRSEATVLATAAPGALIAKVGAAMFTVGERWPGPAPASGRLFLSINDTPGKFGDNQGQVTAAIRAE